MIFFKFIWILQRPGMLNWKQLVFWHLKTYTGSVFTLIQVLKLRCWVAQNTKGYKANQNAKILHDDLAKYLVWWRNKQTIFLKAMVYCFMGNNYLSYIYLMQLFDSSMNWKEKTGLFFEIPQLQRNYEWFWIPRKPTVL